jgi:hypothetical protein
MLCTLQHLHILLKTLACRRKFLPHQAGVPQRRARAVLFNRQTTNERPASRCPGLQAQGVRLCAADKSGMARGILADRARHSAAKVRTCPVHDEGGLRAAGLETKQDAERDWFRRDGAEDLTGDGGARTM